MNSQKLIVFDLGGVVIDIDFRRIWRAWSEASRVDLSDAHEALGPASSDNEAFHLFERGQITEQVFYQRTAQRTGLKLNFSEWQAGWNAIFIGEMKGTQALLRTLKSKARLIGLSNINAPHHAYTVQHFSPLLEHFEDVIYSHEVGMRKPEPAIFELVSRRSGVQAHDILFFDDMKSNVEGATQVGMKAELFLDADTAAIAAMKFLASEP